MRAYRCGPVAAPGSLLKRPRPARAKPLQLGRKPREHDTAHLEALRQCPCVACALDSGCEAAHIRMSRPGKPNAGMAARPDDRHAVPLCSGCHREQHQGAEADFWERVGMDPLKVAEALYRMTPNVDAMRCTAFVAHVIGGTKP